MVTQGICDLNHVTRGKKKGALDMHDVSKALVIFFVKLFTTSIYIFAHLVLKGERASCPCKMGKRFGRLDLVNRR